MFGGRRCHHLSSSAQKLAPTLRLVARTLTLVANYFWLSLTFREKRNTLCRMRSGNTLLSRLQHSLFQKSKTRSPIALPLDELQSMNLSFHWAIAPGQMEGGFDGSVIA